MSPLTAGAPLEGLDRNEGVRCPERWPHAPSGLLSLTHLRHLRLALTPSPPLS